MLTAVIRDTGLGVLVAGQPVVWERQVSLTVQGVPVREDAVTILHRRNWQIRWPWPGCVVLARSGLALPAGLLALPCCRCGGYVDGGAG